MTNHSANISGSNITGNFIQGNVDGNVEANISPESMAVGNNASSSKKQADTTTSDNQTINTGGGNYNEKIEGNYAQGNYYEKGQSQPLAQAAYEIQTLLKQLESTYPTNTTSGQMVVATEVIKHIEADSSLKQRVIKAIKEGGIAAFEKAIDNPVGAFITGAIRSWE